MAQQSHPTAPPPAHIIPVQPASSPPSGHTTIVVLVVSLGGLFFLACLLATLFFLISRRKNKTVQKSEVVDVDEHLKVKEAVVPGPHGTQSVVLSVEEDVHVHEDIKKNKTIGKDLHNTLVDGNEGSQVKANTQEDTQARAADNFTSSSLSTHHLMV